MIKEEMEKVLYSKFEKFKEDFLKTYATKEYKEHKAGDKIKFAGLEWFIVRTKTKKKENLLELMLADKLPQDILEKVFDDETMRDDYRIKFAKDTYDWKESYIREKLNTRFIDVLGINRNDLVQMTTNYAEDEYTKDLVRIPSLKDCRELPKEIIKRDYNYFLINKGVYRQDCDTQPYYGTDTGVFVFNPYTGSVGIWYSFRVVLPIITIKESILGGNE